MPTTRIELGGIYLAASGSYTPHPESEVVGPPPQWSDGSDATYATTWNKTNAAEGWSGSDRAVAAMIPLAIPKASIKSLAVGLRATTYYAGASSLNVQMAAPSGGYVDVTFQPPASGTFNLEMSIDMSDPTRDLDSLPAGLSWYDPQAPFVESGSTVLARITGPFGYSATYLELTLDVTYAAGCPPLRQYPRNDGLAGSARRMWPPTRSSQGSIRRLGGYL